VVPARLLDPVQLLGPAKMKVLFVDQHTSILFAVWPILF